MHKISRSPGLRLGGGLPRQHTRHSCIYGGRSRERDGKSMQAQTYRSMDAACTGVWRTEVSQRSQGAETRWGLGTKHMQVQQNSQKTDVDYRYIHRLREGIIGRKVTVKRVVGWKFVISSADYREPLGHCMPKLSQRGLGRSHTRKLFLVHSVVCLWSRFMTVSSYCSPNTVLSSAAFFKSM